MRRRLSSYVNVETKKLFDCKCSGNKSPPLFR